jgi:hypothetical protein
MIKYNYHYEFAIYSLNVHFDGVKLYQCKDATWARLNLSQYSKTYGLCEIRRVRVPDSQAVTV